MKVGRPGGIVRAPENIPMPDSGRGKKQGAWSKERGDRRDSERRLDRSRKLRGGEVGGRLEYRL